MYADIRDHSLLPKVKALGKALAPVRGPAIQVQLANAMPGPERLATISIVTGYVSETGLAVVWKEDAKAPVYSGECGRRGSRDISVRSAGCEQAEGGVGTWVNIPTEGSNVNRWLRSPVETGQALTRGHAISGRCVADRLRMLHPTTVRLLHYCQEMSKHEEMGSAPSSIGRQHAYLSSRRECPERLFDCQNS